MWESDAKLEENSLFDKGIPRRDVASLRSKRFRLVWEQRKTEEQDSRFWPREK